MLIVTILRMGVTHLPQVAAVKETNTNCPWVFLVSNIFKKIQIELGIMSVK
jgi:hypothetical protein